MTEKQVQFNNKGEKIFGVLHLPKGRGKSPAVLMFHGLTGHKAEAHFMFVKCARKLAKKGFAVLRFDFRGSGDSEGEFKNMSLGEEISDAFKVIEFIKKQKNIDREKIGVLGLSMGGLVAANVCGNTKDVKSLVLFSVVADFKALWDVRLAIKTGGKLPKAGLDFGAFLFGKKLFKDVAKYHGKNLASMRKYSNPLLIVHGDKDAAVPVKDAYTYYKASKSKDKKLMIIKGGDHVYSTLKNEKRVIDAACNWFKRTLK